ncbi:MAG: hypothetical protein LBJ17_03440 [Dysgonamonadaceae bacterium]|jgi:hypothetical protein|nr:hypothetical protein [Dysgonamonadaceae bacterium]
MEKKSTTESGISTNVANFDKLTGVIIGFGNRYNPGVARLTVNALQEQSVHVKTSINEVDDSMAHVIIDEGHRQEQFSLLLPLATRIQASTKFFGMVESTSKHVKEIVRKIRGKRVHSLESEAAKAGDKPTKHISVSQVSFTEQIEHLNQLIMLLAADPAYKPTEADMKIDGLRDYYDRLGVVNDACVETNRLLEEARERRNELLYTPVTGMIDTALAVKEYVKFAFGVKSPEYKEVYHITFKKKSI